MVLFCLFLGALLVKRVISFLEGCREANIDYFYFLIGLASLVIVG